MQTVLQTLTDAIGTGELINIGYYGGSEPGKARMIQPISLDADKVRARCHKTNQVKGFWLDKIALAGDEITDYTGKHKTPDYDAIDGIATIDDLIAGLSRNWKA